MPLVLRHRRLDVLDGDASTVRGVIQRYIVFERVGAGHVVVVAVLPPPDQTAGGIFATGDRLELDFDRAVLDGSIRLDAPGKRSASRLLQNVRWTWRGVVLFDRPFRRATPGHTRLPSCGKAPRLILVKVDVDRVSHDCPLQKCQHACAGDQRAAMHHREASLYCCARSSRSSTVSQRIFWKKASMYFAAAA